MRNLVQFRNLALVLVVSLLLATGACGTGSDSEPNRNAGQDADSQDVSSDNQGSDNAYGSTRDEIAFAVSKAFENDNGKATWEGDTLVLALDGDAEAMMAGFTQCRVLNEILGEDDASVVAFPNGRVDCADVLAQ